MTEQLFQFSNWKLSKFFQIDVLTVVRLRTKGNVATIWASSGCLVIRLSAIGAAKTIY